MFDQGIFGEKLRAHRKALNLTQEEVAEKIGVSGQAVSKWENGECLPDCYNLKLLGEVYGISLDILLETENNSDAATVIKHIKQLATEFIWAKARIPAGLKGEKYAHIELCDDLWQMWKAIYFVEIGDKKLQDREMEQGKNRISGPFGAKLWDDSGVALVVKSALREQYDLIGENERLLLQTLLNEEYFKVLKHLDCHYLISREDLLQKSGLDAQTLNAILIYLTENRIVEFFTANNLSGYKLKTERLAIAYGIMALAYLLTQTRYSTSEYLPG